MFLLLGLLSHLLLLGLLFHLLLDLLLPPLFLTIHSISKPMGHRPRDLKAMIHVSILIHKGHPIPYSYISKTKDPGSNINLLPAQVLHYPFPSLNKADTIQLYTNAKVSRIKVPIQAREQYLLGTGSYWLHPQLPAFPNLKVLTTASLGMLPKKRTSSLANL